ncbi:FtsX-like permease family protein [Streptomyces sp. JJ38]|uniref:ABC transporter permease n=1 Tax=Streptomyces sp. JJ38 TaxID=2738128 RepID=UPI001C594E5A|nr:FtsX-like permease family protein [Streptomyces sp. JJ38]MBW1597341.1 ABC transporter permease [Streptomyces sp. JJ38]
MIARWLRELALGVRFAATGGRAGWARAVLTATGVGIGVTVLLVAACVPNVVTAVEGRSDAREHAHPGSEDAVPKAADTLKVARVDTEFRGRNVYGRLVQPDGEPSRAVRPPGVRELPGPGELVVSPGLKELLASGEGKLLAERFDGARVVGTIGEAGLTGPSDLAFYRGADTFLDPEATWEVVRVDSFGPQRPAQEEELPAELVLLALVVLVVLLLPVAMFVATAVRLGGEARDRRLAALRLVGSDIAMTRRIAAGEALFGAVLGLLLGGGAFLLARANADRFSILGHSLFPSDIQPSGALTAVILLAVPVCAVLVTLFALRRVSIEPLGVFREGADSGRRLWWRVALLVLGGLVLLVFGPKVRGSSGGFEVGIVTGVVLVLLGITALLPWVVEWLVSRAGGGTLSWQLALRRLQLSSGPAARAVSGVTVAVAGAVALQMLFSPLEERYTSFAGEPGERQAIVAAVGVRDADHAAAVMRRFESAEGIRSQLGFVQAEVTEEGAPEPDEEGWRPTLSLAVADCATLRLITAAETCADGDVFLAAGTEGEPGSATAPAERPVVQPGDRLDLQAGGPFVKGGPEPLWWAVPADARPVTVDAGTLMWTGHPQVLATPGALDVGSLNSAALSVISDPEPGAADAVEHVRNAAGLATAHSFVWDTLDERTAPEFALIRTGLFVGAVLVMLMIGVAMVVQTMEQLRERKRQLSVLVAFGTRRATLGASVLWQTAVPVVLGLLLASAGGLALGRTLLWMADVAAADWLAFLPLVGAGLVMVALVTLASLPVLWRAMRPDGLRTE